MRIDELRPKLEIACQQYHSEGEESDGMPNDKAGMVAYLDAIAHFLVAAKIERSLLRPIRDLIAAFRDTEEGINSKIFRKRKRARRPPLSADRAALMAVASVAITRLMDAGYDEEEASYYAARRLTSAGIKIGNPRSDTTAGTSLRFTREKVMDGRLGEIAADLYGRMIEHTKSGDSKIAADNLLDSITELHNS